MENPTEIKKISLAEFRGYKHNRYDGYNSDFALLIAAGGNGTADCFVSCDCEHAEDCSGDCHDDNGDFGCIDPCDCDGQESIRAWFEDGIHPDNFNETVLENLNDLDLDKLVEFADDVNESVFTLNLYCGMGSYAYVFEKIDGKILCECYNGELFEVSNLINTNSN